MIKKYLVSAFIILLLVTVATASMIIPANDNAKEHSKAPENSPVIGENWDLERIDFIHYAKSNYPAKPIKQETCYKLLGGKWNSLSVNYVINPTNPQGLSEYSIKTAISAAAETWDSATSQELFNDIYTIDYTAQYGVYDHKNSIAFGSLSNNDIIAVTSIWITRGKTRQIVEFDQLYNTYYTWGDVSINPDLMDLQNIATHELGHSVGLDDIYSLSCSSVTMFGYSDNGDVDKRSLENPDITGLRLIYGI